MSETNDTGEVGSRKKTLSLRRGGVEKSTTRQSFSHGRTKSVVVEKKKRRVVVPGQGDAPAAEAKRPAPAPAAAPPQEPRKAAPATAKAAPPADATPATPAPTPAPAAPAARADAPPSAPAPASQPAPTAETPAPAATAATEAPAPAAKAPAAPSGGSGTPSPEELAAQALNMPRRPRIIGKAEVRREPPPVSTSDAPRRRSAQASTPGAGARTDRNDRAERGDRNAQQRDGRDGGRNRSSGPRGERDSNRRGDDRGGQRRERGQVHRTLSKAEQEARARALAMARSQQGEQKKRAEEEAERERKAIEDAKRQLAEEELRREREEARRQAEAELEARRKAEAAKQAREKPQRPERAAEQRPAETQADAEARAAAIPVRRKSAKELEEDEAASAKAKKARATPTKTAGKGDDRRKTKLTITTALDDDSERGRSLAALRRRREKEKRGGSRSGPREKVMREVTIPDAISIQDLASRMSERGVDVIKLLMKQGQMHKITDIIDADTAELVVTEFGHSVKRVSEADVEIGVGGEVEIDEDTAESRPPVVTIMGHVDHGKTSLLDAIRKANVVSGEAGGITQHIGAYQVELDGQKITFLDTPGHAAFTQMRARGAKATDIVILVVAADDGVMPQTAEAISHAKAAEVPIIVAINKIDLPAADPMRVKTDLLQHDIVTESLSGDVQEVEVSALKGTNLDKLLEACLLQAEILELKANPEREASGVVVEAQLDKGRGAVATVLVQQGSLHVGDIVIAGTEWGKVRALVNDQGERVKDAGPSMPVEILGLNATPEAGDQFVVVDSEARAREITEYRERQKRETSAAPSTAMSLEQMMAGLQDAAGKSEFPIVLKGDVQGSVEAIVGALEKLNTDEVATRILHQGVGAITESDVTLAAATGGVIVAFNVRASKQARDAADRAGVEIRYYSIIYNLIDDVRDAMSGMLKPEVRETFIGYAEILQVFSITKVGKVAGCRVTEGMVERGAGVRLLRDNVVIHEGTLKTLKRFKDEVKDVQVGQECGMAFEKYEDIREGDVIECFRVEEVERTLA